MSSLRVSPSGPLRGRIRVPGDKSVSHRALLLGALARGTTRIRGLLDAEDVGRTLTAVRLLGCDASADHVTGPIRAGDPVTIDCGNSGTTARLLLGLLAPRRSARLDGDESLRRRPMRRVCEPVGAMGGRFSGGGTLPLGVEKADLHGVDWVANVASAQVKSAILLAGLAARGATRYTEPVPTRDHTERMLGAMGASLRREGRTLVLEPGELDAIDVDVPGDISSAAFWMVAAAIVPGSDVVIENVGLNPTRTGILDALTRMGAAIEVEPAEGFEPVGTVRVRGSELRGIHLGGDEIPRIIDEIPVLAIAAAFATGVTTIRDAAELRVKESDRIAAVVAGIRALGGEASAVDDGMVISGKPGLERSEADVWSLGDHRIAMAFAVAGLRVGCRARDTDCIATSYPEFGRVLGSLGASVTYEQRGAHA